MLDVDAVKVFF